ncbi:MAG: uracil-DNA glycosylase [Candidatus Moeniiplasma glomeromycotorum]|nr:uracil-DNA glycosylase [Candidatus Moeniiplasma glomeromycotorum]MCE8169590.1 uracil-DNA glycosylase [Candidatus Moeniiplasma glomeromycotorum]
MNTNLIKEFNLDQIEPSWGEFFQSETQKDYFFSRLLPSVEKEYKNYPCWPKKENIFRLFREVALEQIKVVILGQDPYHLPNVADGIAFSTQKEKYIPASLRNIFRELSSDLSCAPPSKGDLLPWVKEGVFLINTALSVRDGQALSHMKLWEEFIYSLFQYLNQHNKQIIWVFWGQKARQIGEKSGVNSVNNFTLFSTHPSPYSAESKTRNQTGYFIGSRVFSEVNRLLLKLKKEPVNWLTVLKNGD